MQSLRNFCCHEIESELGEYPSFREEDSAVGVGSLTWGDDDDGGGGEVEEEQMTSERRFFGGKFRHNCVVIENLEDAEEKKQIWSGLSLGLPCWRSQVRNPLPAKARGLPSRSSSSRACLVRVTSLMWFASYCIETRVLPCAHPKGSGCGSDEEVVDPKATLEVSCKPKCVRQLKEYQYSGHSSDKCLQMEHNDMFLNNAYDLLLQFKGLIALLFSRSLIIHIYYLDIKEEFDPIFWFHPIIPAFPICPTVTEQLWISHGLLVDKFSLIMRHSDLNREKRICSPWALGSLS
ncbi:hypothetical protein H5410_048113 [Solanum commersonii]|uniref:Uncharacterized protein n=1 Tax=Solanum commersonii TaxID=4109 RepID=A0A9J5XJE5_SOLCO|nr:hypothetical protein H5410_048113 [Solanum commersonii]